MAADAERENQANIGSLISLTSKSEVRYEGYLFYLNPHDSTIGLRHVRSFGTEERCKSMPLISMSDKIYDYIYFRGSDLKDLKVISSPSPRSALVVPEDPAIMQSHFPHTTTTTMASTSHGAAKVANISTSAQPILPIRPIQLNHPRDPSASSSTFWGSSLPPPPANISRFAVPNYCQGLVGSSGGVPHFPPLPQSLLASYPPVQQQAQHQNVNTSVAGESSFSKDHRPLLLRGSTASPNTLPPLLPTPSVQSNHGQFAKLVSNISSIPMPNNGSSALSSVPMDPCPKMASSLPEVLNVNATPGPVTNESRSAELTDVSFRKQSKLSPIRIEEQSGLRQSSPSQSLQTTGINAKTALAPVMEPLPSDSTEETLESLLTPTTKTLQGSTLSHRYKGQFARGRDQVHQGPAFTYPRYRGCSQGRANVANGVSLYTHQSSSNHAVGSGNGDPRLIRGFKEDFDFEAMNAKFNKEEVWELFRKNNKAKTDEGNEDKETDGDDVKGKAREVHVKDDSKPAYCKVDFFDSLSYCASDYESAKETLSDHESAIETLSDHESAKETLSEERKNDAETFGLEIPILEQDHRQGPHRAGASQASFGGRGHGNVGGGRGRGRTVRGGRGRGRAVRGCAN
ncbi:Protein LSM14 A [Datura stramonium]|uniref:Protein LSM14 A n=1 Tax=Datura stramonium TaxID=4076 RepID=A0ABS8RX84_DATST|nr:Protein LSM14 A [Datura stramonium]